MFCPVPTYSCPFTLLTTKQWSPPLSPDLSRSHKVPSCPPTLLHAPNTNSLLLDLFTAVHLFDLKVLSWFLWVSALLFQRIYAFFHLLNSCASQKLSVALAFSPARCFMSELIPPSRYFTLSDLQSSPNPCLQVECFWSSFHALAVFIRTEPVCMCRGHGHHHEDALVLIMRASRYGMLLCFSHCFECFTPTLHLCDNSLW